MLTLLQYVVRGGLPVAVSVLLAPAAWGQFRFEPSTLDFAGLGATMRERHLTFVPESVGVHGSVIYGVLDAYQTDEYDRRLLTENYCFVADRSRDRVALLKVMLSANESSAKGLAEGVFRIDDRTQLVSRLRSGTRFWIHRRSFTCGTLTISR